MPRPRSLTLDQVAVAALAVLDDDGLDALSMRTVARRLGMSTMGLYRYVADRGQVEVLVVDRVLATVDLTVPPGPAGPQLGALACRVRDAVADHPAVVPLLLVHRHRSLRSQQWGEVVAEVLAGAGFSGTDRVVAMRAVLGYVFGALQIEHYGPLSGAGTDALADLPAAQFPFLSDTARSARAVSAEEEFRGGFDLLLRGLGI